MFCLTLVWTHDATKSYELSLSKTSVLVATAVDKPLEIQRHSDTYAYRQKHAHYNMCVKRFFGYNKYDSTTAVFMELKLPTANTVLHNHRSLFTACWKTHSNYSVVSLIRDLYYA